MSREIKFRAWIREEQLMVKVIALGWDRGGWVAHEEGIDRVQEYIEGDALYEEEWATDMSEVELMQYTGLKDKNGMEIYEGDIVQRECGVGYKSKHYPSFGSGTQTVSKFVVEFDVEEAAFSKLRQHGDSEFSTTFEVIGNICEDAYLLEDAA